MFNNNFSPLSNLGNIINDYKNNIKKISDYLNLKTRGQIYKDEALEIKKIRKSLNTFKGI